MSPNDQAFPTQPDYYWAKEYYKDENTGVMVLGDDEIVLVYNQKDEIADVDLGLRITRCGDDYNGYTLHQFTDYRGPIHPPST